MASILLAAHANTTAIGHQETLRVRRKVYSRQWCLGQQAVNTHGNDNASVDPNSALNLQSGFVMPFGETVIGNTTTSRLSLGSGFLGPEMGKIDVPTPLSQILTPNTITTSSAFNSSSATVTRKIGEMHLDRPRITSSTFLEPVSVKPYKLPLLQLPSSLSHIQSSNTMTYPFHSALELT